VASIVAAGVIISTTKIQLGKFDFMMGGHPQVKEVTRHYMAFYKLNFGLHHTKVANPRTRVTVWTQLQSV
jgi:hypothetical protein